MTSAQRNYLEKALKIESHGMPRNGLPGVFWSIWTPGSTMTGRACLDRGWIARAPGSIALCYHVTEEGKQALRNH